MIQIKNTQLNFLFKFKTDSNWKKSKKDTSFYLHARKRCQPLVNCYCSPKVKNDIPKKKKFKKRRGKKTFRHVTKINTIVC